MNRNSIAVTALAALLACSAHGQALKNARGPHGDTRMQQKARWLGSDRKGAAF